MCYHQAVVMDGITLPSPAYTSAMSPYFPQPTCNNYSFTHLSDRDASTALLSVFKNTNALTNNKMMLTTSDSRTTTVTLRVRGSCSTSSGNGGSRGMTTSSSSGMGVGARLAVWDSRWRVMVRSNALSEATFSNTLPYTIM